MKRHNKIENSLLKMLFRSSSGIDSYTAFRRCKVSYPSFSAAIDRLKALELATEQGSRLKLTKSGREFVLVERKNLMGQHNAWRLPLHDMMQHKQELDGLYVPSIRRLDGRTFNLDNIQLD